LRGFEPSDLFRRQANFLCMLEQMIEVVGRLLFLVALIVTVMHLAMHHPSLAFIGKANENSCQD
jgi:hypothetical protein